LEPPRFSCPVILLPTAVPADPRSTITVTSRLEEIDPDSIRQENVIKQDDMVSRMHYEAPIHMYTLISIEKCL
jgi:hypothetical protein